VVEWVRKPIFAKCHSERSEESYTLKVYEIPEVRFFAYAQNDSDNAASEFPNLLVVIVGGNIKSKKGEDSNLIKPQVLQVGKEKET